MLFTHNFTLWCLDWLIKYINFLFRAVVAKVSYLNKVLARVELTISLLTQSASDASVLLVELIEMLMLMLLSCC